MIEDYGLDQKSIGLAEQIMSVNKKKLRRKMESIAETAYEAEIIQAIKIQLDL